MIIHIAAPGDTLFSVASRYGVPVGRLLADNGFPEPTELVPGEALLVLVPDVQYTVREGDTLSGVASAFGTTPRALIRNDPSLEGKELFPGETVVISFEGGKEGKIVTNGFAYPFIDRAALASALPYLDELTVFTYGFDRAGALLPPAVDDRPAVSSALAAGSAPVLLLSTLGPEGRFDNTLSTALFSDRGAEERLIPELLSTMDEKGYRALEIDFEYVEPEEREAYAAFVSRLTSAMNESGYPVTVALAPKTFRDQPGLLYEAHDYALLGGAANRATLMTYEWGYAYGPPMAVAPLDKVRAVVDYALSEIPANKIFLGIPNYGYDWTLPYTPGRAARSLSPGEARALALETRSEILFDGTAQAPYFYYTDGAGEEHAVWFEDARSFLAKLRLIAEKGLAGYAVWTVMRRAQTLFSETNALFELAGDPPPQNA